MKLNPVAYVKANPGKTILAVVIGGIVLIVLMRGSSGSSGSSSGGGYTTEMIAAAQQQAQLNAQASAQNAQIQGQIAGLTIQSNTTLQLAELERQARSEELGVGYLVAQLQSAENLQSMQMQSELARFQMTAQNESIEMQLANQLANQSLFVNGQIQLAEISAGVSTYALQSQVDIAGIQANRDIQLGSQQARSSRSSSRNSLIGSIAGGIIGLFCDIKIKDTECCVSTSDCLKAIKAIPLDRWGYKEESEPHKAGDTRQHVGTYAQHFYAALKMPDAESRTRIEVVDIIGVLIGAVKELESKA